MGQICSLRVGHVIRRMRSGCRRIINGILWDMSELITGEWIAAGSSNLDKSRNITLIYCLQQIRQETQNGGLRGVVRTKGATTGGKVGGGGPDPPPKKKNWTDHPNFFDEECDYRYATDCSARNWVYHPYFVLYNNLDQGIGPPTLKTWLRPWFGRKHVPDQQACLCVWAHVWCQVTT